MAKAIGGNATIKIWGLDFVDTSYNRSIKAGVEAAERLPPINPDYFGVSGKMTDEDFDKHVESGKADELDQTIYSYRHGIESQIKIEPTETAWSSMIDAAVDRYTRRNQRGISPMPTPPDEFGALPPVSGEYVLTEKDITVLERVEIHHPNYDTLFPLKEGEQILGPCFDGLVDCYSLKNEKSYGKGTFLMLESKTNDLEPLDRITGPIFQARRNRELWILRLKRRS